MDALLVGFDNPLFADADRDGLDDAWELANGLSVATNDRAGDLDLDGLSNFREYLLRTAANKKDTDDDGLPDGWEVQYGLDPRTNDANGDLVGDGVTNLVKSTGPHGLSTADGISSLSSTRATAMHSSAPTRGVRASAARPGLAGRAASWPSRME